MMTRIGCLLCLSFAVACGTLPASAQSQPTQTPATPSRPATAENPQTPATVKAPEAASPKAATGPTDPKAKKSFEDAQKLFKDGHYAYAFEDFRKADKQDGGHCIPCEVQALKSAEKADDFKAAKEQAALLLDHTTNPVDKSRVHAMAGTVCLSEGIFHHKEKSFEAADAEFKTALDLHPGDPGCLYADATALAYLKQDGDARERFQQFLKVAPSSDINYARAQRFADHPELARARVAPNFELTSLDGKKITLESLTGKVVLIDFWATWCGPCREALPHLKQIAKRFAGPQFQVVSISMDKDDAKWREFVAQNEMTWIQYRDGYFDGPIAKMFSVDAIPATFTIDADGVLQDQHVGDADIEGKLKKLIAKAQDAANKKTVAELR